MNAPSSERASCTPPNVVTPQSSNDNGIESRLKGFSLALKKHSDWSSKLAFVKESPLYQQLETWSGSEKDGQLRISPPREGGVVDKYDKRNIVLCVAALSGLNQYASGTTKLIGRAFGVTSRQVNNIYEKEIEQLPILDQETENAGDDYSFMACVASVTNAVDTLCAGGYDSWCQPPNYSASIQATLSSQVSNSSFQVPHYDSTNIQTARLSQVTRNLAENVPTASTTSANPRAQAVLIENEPVSTTQNADSFIVNSIFEFRKKHSSRGTRPTAHEDAVQAIDAAILYNADTPEKQKLVQKRFGFPNAQMKKKVELAAVSKRIGFKRRQRNTRKDCTRPEAKIAINRFCHDDAYTRLDSNSNRRHMVKDDPNGATTHSQRVWICGSTIFKRYEAFIKSRHFTWFMSKHPMGSISEFVFRKCCCKCCRAPTENSCVDEAYTAVEWMQGDWSRYFNMPAIKAFEDTCKCPWHTKIRYRKLLREALNIQNVNKENGEELPPVVPEPALALLPTDFLDKTCCLKRPEPHLKYDKGIPEVIPHACVFEKCPHCGHRSKLEFFNCPALKNNEDIKVDSRQWRKAPRRSKEGKKQRYQNEETVVNNCTLKGVMQKFEEIIGSAREHHWNAKWGDLTRDIDTHNIGEFSFVRMADYSASPDLKANTTLNSSEANHCVYEIHLVIYDSRVVEGILDKGGIYTHSRRICDCEAFHVIGETESSGKKNDAAFHIPVADYIMKIMVKRLIDIAKRKLRELEGELEERDQTEADTERFAYLRKKAEADPDSINSFSIIEGCRDWTDNCKAQYKCRKNFLSIAKYAERYPGVSMRQRFPEKEQFKTEVDGEGKVGKQNVKCNEKAEIRSANGYGMYCTLAGPHGILELKTDHKQREREKSPKLLDRGMTTITRRSLIYVTEKADVFNEIKDLHEHVILIDRDSTEDMKVLSKKRSDILHEVVPGGRVGDHFYKLTSYLLPCSCINCRKDDDDQCHFLEYRKPVEHVVANSEFDPPDDKRPLTEDEEQMKMLYPSDNITHPFMNDLIDRYQLGPKNIKKAEKMKRIVEFIFGRGADDDSSCSDESEPEEDDSDDEGSEPKDYNSGDEERDSEKDGSDNEERESDDERETDRSSSKSRANDSSGDEESETKEDDSDDKGDEERDSEKDDADDDGEEGESEDERETDQRSSNSRGKGEESEPNEDDESDEEELRNMLRNMSVVALKALCRKRGYSGYAALRKPNLIQFIIDRH